jgi:hypothetical protein
VEKNRSRRDRLSKRCHEVRTGKAGAVIGAGIRLGECAREDGCAPVQNLPVLTAAELAAYQ